ncbi:MAG: LPS assembly protein LptD, partial [Pseudomonadota bacterium]
MRRKAACRTARRRLGLPPLAAPVLVFSLASWPALAQEPFSLKLSRELSPRPATVTVLADRAELSATGISTMSGNVEVRSGDRRIIADSARYDATTGLFDVAGHVQLMDNNVEIAGDLAQFDTPSGAGAFTDATFRLTSGFGRGTAASISTPGDQSLELEDVRYSTCPVDNDDWVLEAPFTRLDKENGVGYARSVRVEFKGVPILYAPFLSFPVSDQRKSGFLMPQIGNSQRNGIDVELPYYFNIAPNFDYTLTPRLLTRRGLQVKNSLRYLLPRSDGNLFVEYLPSDSVANRDRGYARLAHTTRFASGWRLIADASHVTDTRYFEDLGSSLAANSLTHTERRFDALYRSEHWLLRGRVQGFQTLDRNLTADQEPYASLPQLFALGRWRDGLAGLTWEWESELVSFYRATGVTGERLDLKPSVSLPIVTPGISVEPSVTLQHTQYSLRDTEAGADRSPSRTAPIYSVDSRAVFERAAGSRGQLLQTLEPRVRYIHIPFRNQDALPVFDTG